jgi:starch synthase
VTPRVALAPWGDLIEDFLEPAGLTLEAFRDELDGGWLFGWVEALARAGVEARLVCVSRAVRRVERWRHAPTGAPLTVLPPSRAYLRLRGQLADPGAWTPPSGAERVAHELAPYLATPLRALGRELRAARVAAIVVQEYEYPRFDAAVVLGRAIGVPVFGTFQGGDQPRTSLERAFRPLTVRACAGLVIGSKAESDRVRSRYGLADDRIARVPNPLDVAPWAHGDRANLGIADDDLVVAWHGRVDMWRKGLDVLAHAWTHVRGPHRRLLLVGTGADAPQLRRLLADHGIADDVIWIDEYVLDRARLASLLRAADVYAFPSRHEGFPVAPIEALAAGLPIVAAAAPGVAEILPDGERSGGVIVPAGDADALATALVTLLADPARRAALAHAARTRAHAAFSLEAVGEQLSRFLLPS